MSMSDTDPWADDLLGRREEALAITSYIESMASSTLKREDKQAFTLAIDADYGIGKSFFVRRLAEAMKVNHPVAFVDAWADDLADEPFVALAATLQKALAPLAVQRDGSDRLKDFMSKSGRVAKIISGGLLRRGLGLAISAVAVDALEAELGGVADQVKDVVADGVAEASKASVDDTFNGLSVSTTMEQRIAEFEDTKETIAELKYSLKRLVELLDTHETLHAPIVIFIDELDRCRPTYSVKLLEEIKHLFDVPGIVFVLSMNGDQLCHSVSGAYGSGFDGRAYLRRFIDRRYQLSQPSLTPLLRVLFDQAGIRDDKFFWFSAVREDGRTSKWPLYETTAAYMTGLGLGARDAYQVVDILRTCQALISEGRLIHPYLMPLIIGHIKGLPRGAIPQGWLGKELRFRLPPATPETVLSASELASSFHSIALLPNKELLRRYNEDDTLSSCVVENAGQYQSPEPLYSIRRYVDLLETVGRFDAPTSA